MMQLQTTSEKELQVGSRAQLLIGAAGRAVIDSQDAMSKGADLVKQLKSLAKMAEDERVAIVKPFNDGVKAINERFKAMTAPLLEAARTVEGRMLSYTQEQQRIAREAIAAQEAERRAAEEAATVATAAVAAEAASAETVQIPMPVQTPPSIARGVMGSTASVRKTWTFEVTDIVALAAARPDLVQAISARINEEIRGKGGEIPGLRIYQQETMSVR